MELHQAVVIRLNHPEPLEGLSIIFSSEHISIDNEAYLDYLI